MQQRTGILGGTFNPVHVGHLRLALETAEILALNRVIFMPNHTPAHKSQKNILPFELRVELLRAAVSGSPSLEVTTLEGELPQPSYTWNSLHAWQERNPNDHGVFIVGAEDFSGLDTWHRGRELPAVMDFAVMARGKAGQELFRQSLQRLWPEKFTAGSVEGMGDSVPMPGGKQCRFIAIPALDISASLVRTKWLKKQSIRFLLPDSALHVMQAQELRITQCWAQKTTL